MSNCYHGWNYQPDATSIEELLERITKEGDKGAWIKNSEMGFCGQLLLQKKIVMCGECDRAATLV